MQDAFKVLMIHWILQFAWRIAFRCVLHRCGSQGIRCWKWLDISLNCVSFSRIMGLKSLRILLRYEFMINFTFQNSQSREPLLVFTESDKKCLFKKCLFRDIRKECPSADTYTAYYTQAFNRKLFVRGTQKGDFPVSQKFTPFPELRKRTLFVFFFEVW